jgi:hypothetical protein
LSFRGEIPEGLRGGLAGHGKDFIFRAPIGAGRTGAADDFNLEFGVKRPRYWQKKAASKVSGSIDVDWETAAHWFAAFAAFRWKQKFSRLRIVRLDAHRIFLRMAGQGTSLNRAMARQQS